MKIVEIEGHSVITNYLNDKSLVFDCGACVGEFTDKLYDLCGCSIYAYEPDPRNHRKLKKRFNMNNKIVTFNVGIDKELGVKDFHIGNYITASSFFKSHRGLGNLSVSVPVTTIEEETRVFGDIDLLKLDLEGSEIDVIMSMDEITMQKIKQITVEFHLQSKIDEYTLEKVNACREYLKKQFDEIEYVDKGNDGHHGLYLRKDGNRNI